MGFSARYKSSKLFSAAKGPSVNPIKKLLETACFNSNKLPVPSLLEDFRSDNNGTNYVLSANTTGTNYGSALPGEGTVQLLSTSGAGTLTAQKTTAASWTAAQLTGLTHITWMTRLTSGAYTGAGLQLQRSGVGGTVSYSNAPTGTHSGRRWFSAPITDFADFSAAATGTLVIKPTITQTLSGFGVVGPVYANAKGRPTIVLTFDDSEQTQYDNVFPVMQARGLVGTMFVVPTYMTLGNGSAKMSVAQAQAMVAAGWAACCNSTPDDSTTSTVSATALTNYLTVKNYLITNGLAAGGSENHICWTNGTWQPNAASEDIADYLRSNGVLSGRTTQGALGNLITDRFGLGDIAIAYPGCTTGAKTFANLQPIVDQAVSRGQTAVFYTHKVYTGGGSGVNMDLGEFTSWMTYLATLRDAGTIDVLTVPQWYARASAGAIPGF